MSSSNGLDPLRVHLSICERDVIKLVLDFLHQRQLYISLLDLERETGVINGAFGEDIVFLRQLILDGQWDYAIDYIQPLKEAQSFNCKEFLFIIFKYQFLELLCLKSESQIENAQVVQQIVKFLNDLRPLAPNEHEYKKLSYLLTLKNLHEHPEYSSWNPSTGRIQCFQEILPLVSPYFQDEHQFQSIAQGDRLIQLLVKGLLYESCVEHCQARATNTEETIDLSDPNSLLASTRLSESDVSLLSWLHSLSAEIFSNPFEQKSLSLNIDRFEKPALEANWSEQILSTPFKPQTMFPFESIPRGIPKSMEFMSRSLGSPFDVFNRSQINPTSRSMIMSNVNILPTVEEENSTDQRSVNGNSHRVVERKEEKNSSPEKLTTHFEKSRAEILKHFDEFEDDPPKSSFANSNPSIRTIEQTNSYRSIEDFIEIPPFTPIASVEDVQAIRAVDVHPTGKYFAVGSNSKTLRICSYPNPSIRTISQPAKVLFKKGKHHLGSIYCLAWSPSGRLIATGSNDKMIKILRMDLNQPEDINNNAEIELNHHNGTVRDLIFLHERSKDDSILLSGGAGDCQICVTDVNKQILIKKYLGHQGHIFSLFPWDSNNFVSGSEDGTSRFWDVRQKDCLHVIPAASPKSPVTSVAVDHSGQLLAAGFEDTSCLLYDIRGKRNVQIYRPHSNEIRSVRFSVHSYYLLTASYDKKIVMTNLTGDLTKPLQLTNVAGHSDKIIQARWHPSEYSFVTTSADRTCVVWIPSSPMPEIE